MKLLKKRDSFVSNMTFMGIMSAIIIILNALVSLTNLYLPVMGLILSLLLPFVVCLVEVSCKDRYFPIFFIVTILLSFVTTLWNLESTIYYLVSSLISGYIFGLSIKKKIPLTYSILVASLLQTFLIYGFSRLVKVIFTVDAIELFLTAVGLGTSTGASLMVIPGLFIISLIQMSLICLIIGFEIDRFNLEFKDDVKRMWLLDTFIIVSALLIIPFYFINISLSYIFLMASIFLAIYVFIRNIVTKQYLQLIISSVMVLSLIGFVVLNQVMPLYSAFLIFGVNPFIIACINLVFNNVKGVKHHEK